jgi:hypothetical protein
MTEIIVSFHCCDHSGIVAFVCYHGHEIGELFQSKGHLLIVTHVGDSHNRLNSFILSGLVFPRVNEVEVNL